MTCLLKVALALTIAVMPLASVPAEAHQKTRVKLHTAKLAKSRKGPQVAGFSQRAGGYSYDYEDVQLGYQGDGGLRDPHADPQGGPFDSGFFFNSNVTPLGSTAPYFN